MAGAAKATLRFPLPDGAVVCGYSFETTAGMVDAFSVSKQKAAAVAYLEKEKGRAVSTTEAVQGSVWQTEVFPLEMGVVRTLVLTFHTALGPGGRLALPLSLPEPAAVSLLVEAVDGYSVAASGLSTDGVAAHTDLSAGMQLAYTRAGSSGPAPHLATALCPHTGLRHFGMCVPAEAIVKVRVIRRLPPHPHQNTLLAALTLLPWECL